MPSLLPGPAGSSKLCWLVPVLSNSTGQPTPPDQHSTASAVLISPCYPYPTIRTNLFDLALQAVPAASEGEDLAVYLERMNKQLEAMTQQHSQVDIENTKLAEIKAAFDA